MVTKTELIRLQKKCKTDGAISKELGVSRQRVYQIRAEYGIPSIWAGNDQRNAKIIVLHAQGISVAKIAEKTGISVPQIYVILRSSKKKK